MISGPEAAAARHRERIHRGVGRPDTPKSAARVEVHGLTPDRWSDLVELFGRPGAAVPRRCWCMYYRQPGVGESAEANREALRSLLRSEAVPGLVAYLGGSPVGWISLGPRDDYPTLQRSPVAKPIDDVPVWSIVCFFVDSKLRGGGIAERLLRAGVAYARSKGATFVEAYPVDKRGRVDNESAFVGTRPMFARAGFQEVARRKPTRPVMRKALRTGAE